MTPAEFRRFGHALVEWVAAYRERLETLPVQSPVGPGDVRAAMPASPPALGGGLEGAIAALDRVVLPGITHWNHPRWFAYFPANTNLASVLADLVASGLGAQGMSWVTSPAATEVEEVVLDWLRQMLGLSPAWSGVIHDTASTATLCALLCARERTSGFAQHRGGVVEGPPMVVYASAEAHSSVAKAVLLAGFGKEHLRLIDTDDDNAMRVDSLAAAIDYDRALGRRPCAIVATIGSTGTTAVDPLAGIAAVAEREDVWLHVDAALAGSAMILPECRVHWDGVESADSLVLNPHKWLGAGFDLSTFYVRDPEHLIRVMGTNPSYLRTQQDGAVTNYRDWQIPLGRRFRALKLWFVLADQGVSGLQARLRRDLANAQWLAAQIDAEPGWQRTAPVPFQTVCARHVPAGVTDDDRIAEHNLGIAARINASGFAMVTPAVVRGLQILRVSIGAEATEREHVEALWDRLRSEARGAWSRLG
jgi:aromatic-L-amino-acid decarboxylase